MKLKTLFGKTAENLNKMNILFSVFGALPRGNTTGNIARYLF